MSRVLAQRRGHYLVSIWPTVQHRESLGFSLRASPGCLSNGAEIFAVDKNGKIYPFSGLITSDVSTTNALDTSARSLPVSIFWQIPPTQNPIDYAALKRGVAEVAWMDENTTGDGLQGTFEQRTVMLYGRVTQFRSGDLYQVLQFVIQESEPEDLGTIYDPSQLITPSRYADTGTTTDAGRAQFAKGQWPTIPICGNGAGLIHPILCVVDEVDANAGGGVALNPRKYLVCDGPLNDMGNRDINLVSPLVDSKVIFGTGYTAQTPLATTDDLGFPVTTIAGQFEEPYGTGSLPVSWAAGSPTVTGAGVGISNLQVDDQTKNPAELAKYYLRIASTNGGTMDLVGNYINTHANSSGLVVRRCASISYPAYLLMDANLGGIPGIYGAHALTNPVEVIEWLLRKSRMSMPIDFGSLRSLSTRLNGWNISTSINAQSDPWSYVQKNLLPWLPIRAYRFNGRLKFCWDGPIDSSQVETTLNLDGRNNGIYRQDQIADTDPAQIFNAIIIRYAYNLRRKIYASGLTIGSVSTIPPGGPGGTAISVAGNALARWSQYTYGLPNGMCYPTVRTRTFEAALIGDDCTAGLAANYLLWRWAVQRPLMRLIGQPYWRWLEPGMNAQIVETEATTDSQLWRVQSVTRNAGGDIAVQLEGLI